MARALATVSGAMVPSSTMRRGLPPIVALIGALLALTPLAFASPPDPTWIGGFYDNADYDDVVLAATAAAGALEAAPLAVLTPLAIVVGVVSPAGRPPTPIAAPSAFQIRAPPIA